MPIHSEVIATSSKPTEIIKTSVVATSTAKKLVDAKPRKLLTIFNNSTSYLYIDFGTSVSISDFATRIPPYGYYEAPLPIPSEIRGIWDSAQGKALVREFI